MNICARQALKHHTDIITPPVLSRSYRIRVSLSVIHSLTSVTHSCSFTLPSSTLHLHVCTLTSNVLPSALICMTLFYRKLSKQILHERVTGEVISLHSLNQRLGSLVKRKQMTVCCHDWQPPTWRSERVKRTTASQS